jgi:CheY-like chemotaxis protein
MRTVLFVDNDKIVLRSIERCLRDEPYHKLFTNSSKETLDIPQHERVQIIVNDICPPDMEEHELLRIAGKRK